MNNWRKLRCKQGILRAYKMNLRGDIACTLGDITIPKRLQGKKKKYYQVQLQRGGTLRWYYVHRLMAFSWLGAPPHPLRRIVDHKDGNSQNNKVENLRWVTHWANNINRRYPGQIVEEDGKFHVVVAGFAHKRFRTEDRDVACCLRDLLVENYVHYSMRFPECNSRTVPHFNIHEY